MKKDKSLTLADRIKSFDFYKDLPQDLAEPTMSGASGKNHLNLPYLPSFIPYTYLPIVSTIVICVMAALFVARAYDFIQY